MRQDIIQATRDKWREFERRKKELIPLKLDHAEWCLRCIEIAKEVGV